tara:strand:- start:142 stop:435 length:294 start_codon:yes stop_codon:yes gene_type:complete
MKKEKLIEYLNEGYPLFNVDGVYQSRGEKKVVIKTSEWNFYITQENRLFIEGESPDKDLFVNSDLIFEYLEERLNHYLIIKEHNLKVLEDCIKTLRL